MLENAKPLEDAPSACPPGFDDIVSARDRLAGVAYRTPLWESPYLNDRVGGRVLVKTECLQRTGSFKIRGAYNLVSRIPTERRAAGVVAYSSGNHAQGVAAAARMLDMPATIVMPRDAPALKIDNTRGYGADIVLYDRFDEDRVAIGEAIARERDATIVPPYDHPHIIAGQGTVGLEIAEQCAEAGAAPDRILVCVGGGGLIAGTALAVRERMPSARVIGVEPDAFDDFGRSLEAGRRLGNAPDARSICDALLSNTPGELTFEINRNTVDGACAVPDEAVRDAMAFAFRYLKLVVEPGGAVCLAALLSGAVDAANLTTVVTVSGGNVDLELFAETVRGALDA